ncbi:hypothetical protein MNBD_GAMMA12-1276 [hydrothermal vent metagenome]|uniref:Uncharacterized protein n=1 Tax=hydrothermal vent metagenome TaxID=652676 RepID=A0A3B0XSA1_9ZZZZ
MIYVWTGVSLIVIGLIIYLYIKIIYKPYEGCSGGGLSGLPIAFLLMLAMALLSLGLMVLVVAGITMIMGE